MEYYYTSLLKEIQKNKFKEKWACCFCFDIEQRLMNFKPQLIHIINNNHLEFNFVDKEMGQRWNSYSMHDEYNYIRIFDTEEECTNSYNDQVYEHLKFLKKESERYQKMVEDTQLNFIGTDYLIEKLRRNK